MTANPSDDPRLPTLNDDQIAHIAAHGKMRKTRRGEVLLEYGEESTFLFVVISGEVEILHPLAGQEEVLAVLKRGHFTGELNVISGRPSLVRARAREPGEVIEVERQSLRNLGGGRPRPKGRLRGNSGALHPMMSSDSPTLPKKFCMLAKHVLTV